ncbi:armadillo-type protein [Geranomyces variabilis]|nr:armadillo-type protein [Geranomyces variabilis]KAJ3141792.1 Importin-11 [Geranomyces variabilis]
MSAYEQICLVLQAGVSPDPAQRNPADAQLKQWEVEPGFYSTMQQVAADASLDQRLRLLAAITLKNGIDKYWRKTVRVGAIQPAEKEQIRSKCLEMFAEEHSKIADYNSVVISKIARLDYPRDWPTLLESLVQTIQVSFADDDSTTMDPNSRRRVQYRSLNTLYLVVKVLCSMMMPASRSVYQQIAPELLRYTATIFTARCNHFLQMVERLNDASTPANYEPAENSIRLAAVALKALRRVVVYGFKEYHQVPEVVATTDMLMQYLQKLLPLRSAVEASPSKQINKSYRTILYQIGKVYLNMQKQNIASFVQIPSGIEIVRFYWSRIEESSVPDDDVLQEKLLIQSFKLLRGLIKNPGLNAERTSVYSPAMLDATPASAHVQMETPSLKRLVEQRLLTPEFVTSACQVLVGRYLVIGSEEWKLWQESPEEWFVELEADRWEFSLRGCAEKVFMDLMSTNRAALQPVVMSMLQMVSEPVSDPADFDKIRLKDAVYGAVGLAASDLFDFVNFESWFHNCLVKEATTADPRFTILHRRIAWLTAKWIPVQPSPSLYAPVYELLMKLVDPARDMAVRLAAVAALHTVVDDFGFEVDVFRPYVEPVLSALAALLTEVDGVECLGGVVGCLSGIVERLQDVVAPYVPRLMQVLPELWRLAADQQMFRGSILHIFSKLVVSLREDSEQLHPVLLPILAYSVDVNNPAHVYLLDDGLDLWHAVVCNATTLTEDLHALVGLAVQILDFGSEGLKKALGIIECYVVLDVRVLDAHANGVLTQISNALETLRPEAAPATLRCLDVIVQTTYSAARLPALQQALVATRVIERLMVAILNEAEIAVVVVGCLGIIARLAACEPAWTLALLAETNNGAGIDIWCDKFDNMGTTKQRKLTAVGLTSLCSLLCADSPCPPALRPAAQSLLAPRISAILPIISSVLADAQSRRAMSGYGYFRHLDIPAADADGAGGEDDEEEAELDADVVDDLGAFDQTIDQSPENAPHARRRRALASEDPAVWPDAGAASAAATRGRPAAAFRAYVAAVWTAVAGACGPASFDRVEGADEIKMLMGLPVVAA